MKPPKSTLDDLLLAKYLRVVLGEAPREIDPEVAQYFVDHPAELKALLAEAIGKFKLPVAAHEHRYGPVITVRPDLHLGLVLRNWLRGSAELDKERFKHIAGEQVLAFGSRFRAYVMQCDKPATTELVLKAADSHGWRPGRAFELLYYLYSSPNEPREARRLISLADHEWSPGEPFFALEHDQNTRSAGFIADVPTWSTTDHFFMVADEED